jgi:hypothetical protein
LYASVVAVFRPVLSFTPVQIAGRCTVLTVRCRLSSTALQFLACAMQIT